MHFHRERQIPTIRNKILVIGSQCVNKHPYHFKLNKGGVFEIISLQNHRKIWKKYSHTDFRSVWDPLTCWLSKDLLKRRFWDGILTKSLTVCNFGNTLPMTIFFYLKMFKNSFRFNKSNKKFRKSFSFLR